MFTQDTKSFDTSFTFTCDDYGEEISTISDTLKQAVDAIKQDGWRVVYDEDLREFYHYCESCL
jgi:hypothetical protein